LLIENGASADMLTGQQLQEQGINSTDLLFFDFLCNKNDIDLHYSWLKDEKSLRIKTDTDDMSSKAKGLIDSLRCALKEIYQLEEEQFRNADEFVNKWESFDQIGSVFMVRLKHQFIIMALQENVDQFKDCKRKFEVNFFKQICYNTFERIEVKIINGSFEDLDDVDAIVNPTDDQFGQIGLVSRTLSKKGGKPYDEECKRLRSSKMPTPKKCFVTSWGNVKEKSILHVVCPNIQGEKSQNIQTTVYETIYNCLKKAERKNIATVAIPFVYTGTYGLSFFFSASLFKFYCFI
jgi:O-acetyl-ADP-ribose deacetylase (regulator of RNase III)